MISIIIPVFNQAEKLKQCLESIAAQTYNYYEIVIVNDGSEDGVENVYEEYKEKFGYRINYYSQENKGAASARNRGVRAAKGEFLLFCDADIVLRADALEEMDAVLIENKQAAYVYSSFYWGRKLFKLWPFDGEKLKQMPYIHTTSLVRRSDFPGFDENLKRFQDWDLWLAILNKGKGGVWINKPLFRVAPGGVMSDWLPSFFYKIFPFLPSVKKYKHGVEVIKKKYNLI